MEDEDPMRERPQPATPDRSGKGRDVGSDSLFEILDAPLPSELERQKRLEDRQRRTSQRVSTPVPAKAAASTAPLEAPLAPPVTPRPAPGRRREARAARKEMGRTRTAAVPVRKVRRTIKHIDPLSVLKISLCFYSVFLVVWLGLVVLFYFFLEGLGLFEQLQSLGRDLVLPALENEIALGGVVRWAAIGGAGLVLVGSLINAILAVLYNIFSDLLGGIKVTFSERDNP